MTKKTVFLLSVLFLLALVILPAAAWTLDSGYDSGASLYGGVRYRSFNNAGNKFMEQVFIGIPPVLPSSTWGSANNRVWNKWWMSTPFIIEYKSQSDPAMRVITSTAGPAVYVRPAAGPVNYLEFVLMNSDSGNYVDYRIIKINGESVSSSFTGAGIHYWSARGTGSDNLTIEGTITKHGSPMSGDSSYVEIRFGNLAPKDEQAPLVTNIRVDPNPVIRCSDVTVTANIDDSATGGSPLESAEYAIDGGSWNAMSVGDGAFDEVTEEVTSPLTTDRNWAPGVHSVCVRGTDRAGNPSDGMACNAFTLGYSFDGFFQPVDMAGTNGAKAGQVIPLKWTLSDDCGIIDDPASFSNLYSYPVTCGELSPAADVVEEYAGSSGLQYFGNGLWQFNWKTPKTYAGTCRVMHVGFDDSQYSEIVAFEFR